MSDNPYTDDTEEAPPHPADAPQPLEDFVGAFTDPQAQEVFGDAAVRVQDYLVQRQIADDNQAAADRLVSNLGQFKDGLASMAASDPAATFLGLDLVPNVVEGVVGTHPYLPDEMRQSAYEQLTSDMQRDIARAGVMSLADKNDTAARQLLDHPRVAGLFDDRDRASLNGYIGAMATARDMDATAIAKQRTMDAERLRAVAAVDYFGALLNPRTYELEFPPGWAERVTADRTLPPGDTASMLSVYDRLQKNGDAVASDPHLMADLVTAAASGNAAPVSEVLSQAGAKLRLTDALTLAAMAGPQTPQMRADMDALAVTLQTFRDQVVTPENGPAGMAAFERFVNWAIPAFRSNGSFNPKAENYILPSGEDYAANVFWKSFAPRLDDFVLGGEMPGSPFRLGVGSSGWGAREDRMSLDQIFGAPRRGAVGDQVLYPARPFDMNRGNQAIGPEAVDMGNTPENPSMIDKEGNSVEPFYNNPEIRS